MKKRGAISKKPGGPQWRKRRTVNQKRETLERDLVGQKNKSRSRHSWGKIGHAVCKKFSERGKHDPDQDAKTPTNLPCGERECACFEKAKRRQGGLLMTKRRTNAPNTRGKKQEIR